MKNRIRLTFTLALLCAAFSSAAFASENAYLYVVQGIPGHDYSTTTDPQFPMDVLLNDETCYERGIAFGSIAGPLTFVPGSYDVKVSAANSLAPCSNTPLIDSTVTLNSGESVTAVIGLSQTGTPALLTFTNKFTTVTANNGRVIFALAADSPAVQVVLQNTTSKITYTYNVNPDALLDALLPSGNYTIEVTEGTTTLVPATNIDLYSQSTTLLYAVGEASNNTVNLETKTVRNVI